MKQANNRFGLDTVLLSVWWVALCAHSSLAQTTAPSTSKADPHFVTAMLDAIRPPKPQQFAQPEAVVRFLIEQVRVQDFDEATRAFAVREYYERWASFEDNLRYLRVVDPTTPPLPDAPFHRAYGAMRLLHVFDTLSLILLGLEPGTVTMLPGNGDESAIKIMAAQLNRSRLMGVEIVSVGPAQPVPISPQDFKAKAIGISERAELTAVVTIEGKEVRCGFVTEKIDGNWRVLSVNRK